MCFAKKIDGNISEMKLKLELIKRYLLGEIGCILFPIFVVISIPIYIFRYLLAFLAKWVRPDLEEILDPVSSLWVKDLYSGKSPRCSVIVPITFQGNWTPEKFKQIVLDRWINAVDRKTGELVYGKLRQYPKRWLGFSFWKHSGGKFNVNQNIHYHENKGEVATSEKLNELIEHLLNEPYPERTSPWELHYVANYKNTQDKEEGYSSSTKPMFALILKYHHCLGDGYSFMCAVTEGLCGYSLESLKIARPHIPKMTVTNEILHNLSLLLSFFVDIPYELGKIFEKSPWKVGDENKTWSQLYGRSNLIPIQDVKDIKNAFGVSFASVVLSAMSYGVYKDVKVRTDQLSTMSAWSALPVPRTGKTLTNCFTGALFDIPVGSYPDPVSRLKACDSILQRSQASSVPLAVRIHQAAFGSHLYPVCSLLSSNKIVSIGLSNFPGIPVTIGIDDAIGISCDFAVGGIEGNAGVGVAVQSYANHIRIAVTAEKAAMSRIQMDVFIKNMLTEIRDLYALAKAK